MEGVAEVLLDVLKNCVLRNLNDQDFGFTLNLRDHIIKHANAPCKFYGVLNTSNYFSYHRI